MVHVPTVRKMKKEFYGVIKNAERVTSAYHLPKTSIWNARKFLQLTTYEDLQIIEAFSVGSLPDKSKNAIVATGCFYVAYEIYRFTIVFLDKHYHADLLIQRFEGGKPEPLPILTTIKFTSTLNILPILQDYIKDYSSMG